MVVGWSLRILLSMNLFLSPWFHHCSGDPHSPYLQSGQSLHSQLSSTRLGSLTARYLHLPHSPPCRLSSSSKDQRVDLFSVSFSPFSLFPFLSSPEPLPVFTSLSLLQWFTSSPTSPTPLLHPHHLSLHWPELCLAVIMLGSLKLLSSESQLFNTFLKVARLHCLQPELFLTISPTTMLFCSIRQMSISTWGII